MCLSLTKIFKSKGNEMKKCRPILLTVMLAGMIFLSCSDDNSTEPPDPIEMVYIQGGTFQMGDSFSEGDTDELPVHSVTLSSFYLGKYEVTQAEWTAYMPAENWSSYGAGVNYPAYYVSWYEIIKYCNLRSIAEGMTPVYMINNSTDPTEWGTVPADHNTAWDAAICNWSANGYRLPSEAEWEYAARGGLSGQRFPNGATISHSTNGDTQANYFAQPSLYTYDVSPTTDYHPSYNGKSSPVGSFPPNGYGIYDMAGNLWEWCWDWYSSSYYSISPSNNPTGPTTGLIRAGRGGYWSYTANHCRVACRLYLYYLPDFSDKNIGFRVARTH
jgi:formylglycine-generating enzyme